jgi:hypothetical protein
LLSLLGIAGYGIYRNTQQMAKVVQEVNKDVEAPVPDSKTNKKSEEVPTPLKPPPSDAELHPNPVTAADFSINLKASAITSPDNSVIEILIDSAGLDVVAELEKKRDLPSEWKNLTTRWSWERKMPGQDVWMTIDGELSERLKITGKERLNTEFRVIAIVSSQSGESFQRIDSKIIRVAKITPPPPPAYKPDDFEIDTRFVLKGNEDGQEIEIPLETGVRGAVAKGMIKPKIGVDAGNYETTWNWFVKQPNIPPTIDWKPIEDAKGDILPITKDFAPNSEIRCEATLKFESGDLFVVKSREPPLKISGVLTATIDLREVIKSASIRDLKFPIEIPATLEAITRNESRGDRVNAFGLETQLDAKSGRRIVNPIFRNVRNFTSDTDLRMLEDLENKLKDFQKTHKEIRKKIDALQAVCENKGKDVLWARDIQMIIKDKENDGFTSLKVALVSSLWKAEAAIEKYETYIKGDDKLDSKEKEDLQKFVQSNGWVIIPPANFSNFEGFLSSLLDFRTFWKEEAGSLRDIGGTPKKLCDSLLMEIQDYENDQTNLLRDSVSIETKENAFDVVSKSNSLKGNNGSLEKSKSKRELGNFGMTIVFKFIGGVQADNPLTPASVPSDVGQKEHARVR